MGKISTPNEKNIQLDENGNADGTKCSGRVGCKSNRTEYSSGFVAGKPWVCFACQHGTQDDPTYRKRVTAGYEHAMKMKAEKAAREQATRYRGN